MTRLPILRMIFITMLAAAAAMPAVQGSAAIPCQELPVIEPDPDMVTTMIYIELPVTVEAAFERREAADRSGSTDAPPEAGVVGAAENQFRCLNYGDDVSFAGNSTPEQRVSMWNRPAVDVDEAPFIDVDSVHLERLGMPIQLEDGRYLIDFAIIVDGSQYLTGEMVFSEEPDGLYLDSTTIVDSVTLNESSIEIEMSTRFTREVKIVNATQGDRLVFTNLEDKAHADVIVTKEDGETVFHGGVMGNMMVGGENHNIFVIHDLEPGEYQITISFPEDQVSYNQTLIVDEGDSGTPIASPES